MEVLKWARLSSSLFLPCEEAPTALPQLDNVSLAGTTVKHVWGKHRTQPEEDTANCIRARL